MAARQPMIIISVHGGLVQDVFCSNPDTRIILVDWDQQGEQIGLPGIVEIESDGRNHPVAVVEYEAAKLTDLSGTDVEKALIAAHLHGQLDQPVIEL